MKVEIHVNGRLVIELQPETAIERMVLAEMATGATQGKPVTLSAVGKPEAGAIQMAVQQ